MLKLVSKNEKLRKTLVTKEMTQLLRKIGFPFFYRHYNKKIYRYFWYLYQKGLYRATFTKTRSICLLTGRSRSVYRSFRLSRLKLREYAASGYFTGLAKASW